MLHVSCLTEFRIRLKSLSWPFFWSKRMSRLKILHERWFSSVVIHSSRSRNKWVIIIPKIMLSFRHLLLFSHSKPCFRGTGLRPNPRLEGLKTTPRPPIEFELTTFGIFWLQRHLWVLYLQGNTYYTSRNIQRKY